MVLGGGGVERHFIVLLRAKTWSEDGSLGPSLTKMVLNHFLTDLSKSHALLQTNVFLIIHHRESWQNTLFWPKDVFFSILNHFFMKITLFGWISIKIFASHVKNHYFGKD